MPSKTEQWFRAHSKSLEASFLASALLEHTLTKGSDREKQIIGILTNFLPTEYSIAGDATIVDSEDTEAPKFDAVLFDQRRWPRLYAQEEGTQVVLIESVAVALEVKSSLDGELGDIFNKSKKLRDMRSTLATHTALAAAFAYTATNPVLGFFDFAAAFCEAPTVAPSFVAILNQCIYATARRVGGQLIPVGKSEVGDVPVLFHSSEDTLLLFFYFLMRLARLDVEQAESFRAYSARLMEREQIFYFEADFQEKITGDLDARRLARDCFLRKTDLRAIEGAYSDARAKLGLPLR